MATGGSVAAVCTNLFALVSVLAFGTLGVTYITLKTVEDRDTLRYMYHPSNGIKQDTLHCIYMLHPGNGTPCVTFITSYNGTKFLSLFMVFTNVYFYAEKINIFIYFLSFLFTTIFIQGFLSNSDFHRGTY